MINNLLHSAILLLLVIFLFGCEKEPENQPPNIEIVTPSFGAKFQRGEIITISVNANDNDGSIKEVRFYLNSVGVSSVKNFPYNYEWNTENATPGNQTIKVVAIDDGNLETEASVDIFIEIMEPTVTTGDIPYITEDSAICTGEVTDDGGSEVIECGICWSTNANPTIADFTKKGGSGLGYFDATMNDLEPNTSYFVRAYAKNEKGIAYGMIKNFKTENDEGQFTDSRDGKTYKTVKIGHQTWMVENLAYLPSVSPSSQSSVTTPYYYVYDYQGTSVAGAKATDNYKTYGALYNWPAALAACPAGWHLPSDAEWTNLENYLADNGYNYDGSIGGGRSKIAKSLAATTLWNISSMTGAIGNNLLANNKSGFFALPAGGLDSNNGLFSDMGFSGYCWSSTDYSSSDARGRNLYFNSDYVDRYHYIKAVGVSVRCVKD